MGNDFGSQMSGRKPASRRRRRGKESESVAQSLVREISVGAPLVELAHVRLDGDTQPRPNMSPGTVEKYAEKMTFDEEAHAVLDHMGAKWPEVVVFKGEDSMLWLADGFHRVQAAQSAGIERFQAVIKQGGLREAIAFSLGVNESHGKPRSPKEKRHVVERALSDPEWGMWTNVRIARMCSVAPSFVSKRRRDLESRGIIDGHVQLFDDDGEPHDRTPAPPKAPSPPKSSAHTAKANPADTSGLPDGDAPSAPASCGWDEVERLSSGGFDGLVAYPQSSEHWDALYRLCESLSLKGLTLIVPFYRDTVWAYRGPMVLDALVEEERLTPPALVRLGSSTRAFWVWSERAEGFALEVESAAKLLAHSTTHVVVGTSIDDWVG